MYACRNRAARFGLLAASNSAIRKISSSIRLYRSAIWLCDKASWAEEVGAAFSAAGNTSASVAPWAFTRGARRIVLESNSSKARISKNVIGLRTVLLLVVEDIEIMDLRALPNSLFDLFVNCFYTDTVFMK